MFFRIELKREILLNKNAVKRAFPFGKVRFLFGLLMGAGLMGIVLGGADGKRKIEKAVFLKIYLYGM